MTHWANEYMGITWSNGGNSKQEGFDCWNLVRTIQREQFGIDVPVIDVDAYKIKDCVVAFSTHGELKNWDKVEVPQEGDCVLMSQNKRPTHIGVWLDEQGGGIIHSVQGVGVIFTTESHIQSMNYNVLGYYRYAG
ncbi:Endopeptidase, NLPC/P60 domain containing protein [uncultured Caudovirales phage]|uniref:Endopeptidase, NLPC/P60 domain containing protein n=1 Tax=uncultured Caudovirales phage TaxID=2100421 RepID=A0A6J5KTT6_9CAUD|nr:Endopeptidase, NLPC/P60 domain containing protein [uncultured Caudovirales phage]CAB4123550.1 Endopeptidase, NLPC/P60 domain containing protein [uncultured Caudovirales phage]CAB5219726.1 Endopeptidase, NLPC/P60 domain containing protein [uncultured Caudovirales phage]